MWYDIWLIYVEPRMTMNFPEGCLKQTLMEKLLRQRIFIRARHKSFNFNHFALRYRPDFVNFGLFGFQD